MSSKTAKIAAHIEALQADLEAAKKAERDQILTLITRAAERSGLVRAVAETGVVATKLSDIFRKASAELRGLAAPQSQASARKKEESKKEDRDINLSGVGERPERRSGFFGGAK